MSYPIVKKQLFVPQLDKVAEVLRIGLKEHYAEVDVSIEHQTPDLTGSPYNLATSEILGNGSILDIGGEKNLIPFARISQKYDFNEIAQRLDLAGGSCILGAGAGPYQLIKKNSEGMFNYRTPGEHGPALNRSYISLVDESSAHGHQCSLYPQEMPVQCSLLTNVFVSRPAHSAPSPGAGASPSVIHIRARRRIAGDGNFVGSMRTAINSRWDPATQPIGMGGMFLVTAGTVRVHVMPVLLPTEENPLHLEDVPKWLNYFHCKAPFIGLGEFVTHHMELGLRQEHFHGFNLQGEGGHYHEDQSPDSIEYEAFLGLASEVVKVD